MKQKINTINIFKCIILVIIFLFFYILKLGGMKLKENNTIYKSTYNEIEKINGVTYIDNIMIVNKSYPLPYDFVPTNTYRDIKDKKYCVECLDLELYKNFLLMKADALAIGLNIWIQSGYRSYEYQEELYNKYVFLDGIELADTYSARPGHSEHQTGLAFDINITNDDFQYTDESKWINENAYRYGFILRYPKGKENITGYKYEPWHLRYVGIELATKLYNDGDWITLEEYFNIESKYIKVK